MNLSLRLLSKWTLGVSGALAASSVSGMTQSVVVVGDLQSKAFHAEKMANMTNQLKRLSQQVAKAEKLVKQGKQMADIIGNPKSVIESVSTLSGATKQLDYIFRNDTTKGLRSLVNSAESLNKSSTRLNKTIGDTVLVGGKARKRNVSLYGAYSLLERMHANYEDIVSEDRALQRREMNRQKALLDDLLKAQTESDRERIRAAIAASKMMQDASTNAVLKAKGEYDTEIKALEVERQKDAEASREAAEMQRQHMNALIDESNKQWQSHLEKEFFAEKTVDNKIELVLKKHTQS